VIGSGVFGIHLFSMTWISCTPSYINTTKLALYLVHSGCVLMLRVGGFGGCTLLVGVGVI
jgi:hypothetical protein